MKKILLLLLVLLLLTGCRTQEYQEPTHATVVVRMPTTEPEPTVMYPGAVEDYLGNVVDFSWPLWKGWEFVMLHFCSAVVNHPDDPYNMEYVRQTFIDADVSIHYIIDREGIVHCYIPEDRTAWHAGPGTWKDDKSFTNTMNLYAIGIELVGIGSYEDMKGYMEKWQYDALPEEWIGYTDEQYTALKDLLEDISQRNNIPLDREHIIGHEEYNPKKTDPGELFDWDRILP